MGYKADLDKAQEQIEALEADQSCVAAVELAGAAIVIEWREIGGVRVGLNAVGTAVRVELSEDAGGYWFMEALS